MNRSTFVSAKNRVRFASAVTVGLALAALLTTGPASSRTIYEPIEITSQQTTVLSGETLPLDIQLEGPSPIQIYSDPPGAIEYSGDLNAASGTVSVETDPNTPSGPLTVYVATDGSQVASTTITAQQ